MHPTFFIHPPKSGGSTVISFFDLNYGPNHFVNFEWDRDGWEYKREKLRETTVGGGHQSYGIHRNLRIPLSYCTILRDPLARQVSHYWYAFNGKNGEVARGASVSAVEALVKRGEISLDEWVSESYGGENLFVQMLSGRSVVDATSLEIARTNLHQQIKTAGVCEDMSAFLLQLCGKIGLSLPFYVETNRTGRSPQSAVQPSEAAVQKFVDANQLDYDLYRFLNDKLNREILASGGLYSKALDVVKTVQAEINKLENPHLHTSTIFGFDPHHLAKVRSVAREFDLTPIEEYVKFAQARQTTIADMYDGFVDVVRDGTVSGWVVNLSQPDQSVLIEIRVGDDVVAHGWSGEHRPDVFAAGYRTSRSGFAIRLPESALGGFDVAIAGSSETLQNSGTWQQGWHCA